MKTKNQSKNRKEKFEAPFHIRRKFLSARLSDELSKKYKKRSLPLRAGDEVEIMRGSAKKRRGEIHFVDLKKSKIFLKNIKRKKNDGTEVMVPIDPSNTRIIKLNLEDKWRLGHAHKKV